MANYGKCPPIPDTLLSLASWTGDIYGIAQDVAQWGWDQAMAQRPAAPDAQAAADAELQACCEWLEKGPYGFSIAASAPDLTGSLRAARRPPAPSLKEQAMAQRPADTWPTPITDRPPTEADGDEEGYVQALNSRHKCWDVYVWTHAARDNKPWRHTPRWRPPAPSVREQAIIALREQLAIRVGINSYGAAAMELALRALEGGDG